MKECQNCKKVIRTTDKYCRNCGTKIQSSIEITIINIIKTLLIIILITMIIMYIISFLI